MMLLYDLLNSYKIITVKMLDALNEKKYDLVVELIDERQSLIEKIDTIQDIDEFTQIASELDLLEWENKVKDRMNKELENIKKQIKNIKDQKQVNYKYNSLQPIDSVYIYKKL